jgi:glycosyltransferase involved in cell wall biosynthesis
VKLAYINQHFATNAGSTGTRAYDVGRHLLAQGHEVTMICGIFELSGLAPMPPWRLFRTQWVEGMKVIVCNVPYSNKMGIPRRIWAFFGFAALATWAVFREDRLDVVFGTSTPLTVGLPTRIGAALKRVPYVFEVRDLWPEDLVAAGRLKEGPQLRFWEWLERFSYARAKKIVLVSKGFHDRLIERGFSPERLETLLLGGDSALFEALTPDRDFLDERGLGGKFVAIYTGAHGDANGLFQLLDAAELLRDRQDIAIILIGDGGSRAGLMAEVESRGLTNIHLLPAMPKVALVPVLAACDVGLMILKQIERPRWVTPNKLFDYLFAGLPVLVNFAGTTADLVEDEGVGAAVEPGSAEALAAQLCAWADEPAAARSLGVRARELALARYDRKAIAQRLAEILDPAR